MDVHPTAVVDPAAQLGSGVHIGPYAVVGPQVRLGKDTSIGAHAVITGRTRIGKDNRVFPFAALGGIPQDKKYAGEDSELVVGDGNTIREFVTINCGTSQDRNCTRIGDRNWIMAYVHIAHDCVVGNDTVFANGATLAGHVQVEDRAVLGGFTLVHQFCRVGAHAFCGMGAGLNRDLPPYFMATGNPARLRGLNREGLKRAGFAPEAMAAIGKAYRYLVHGQPDSATKEFGEQAQAHAEVARIRDFLDTSQRGILHADAVDE